MKAYRYVILAGVLVIATCVFMRAHSAKRSREIEIHRQKLGALASSLSDEIISNEPRRLSLESAIKQEREALIRLGYFVDTDIRLDRRYLTPQNLNEFSQKIPWASFSNHWGTFALADVTTNEAGGVTFTNQAIHVIAYAGDLPKWEKVVADFDLAGAN